MEKYLINDKIYNKIQHSKNNNTQTEITHKIKHFFMSGFINVKDHQYKVWHKEKNP